MASTQEKGHSNLDIKLTEKEALLKTLLLDVARYINPSEPSVLRFTGGWVRDKLLGEDSHDVDVGINDMTGYQFGLKMKEYLESSGNRTKYGLENSNDRETTDRTKVVHALHKIEANPEKSKHLETVTTSIFGLDIDLVNLRKEVYSEDSRNPQMEFGTPEEDALRRDATVNALFYNIQTNTVEDFTRSGLLDMQQKIIRTPLEPHQTFKDDPLRVLRLIRFASRLNYTIDSKSRESMKDESIKEALKLKISRERVGVELTKMLQGPNPLMALSLIDELGLYHTIFCDPTSDIGFTPDTNSWSKNYDFVRQILSLPVDNILRKALVPDEGAKFHAWLQSAFVPFADAPLPKSGKQPPAPVGKRVAREGIKAPSKISSIIGDSLRTYQDIISVRENFTASKRVPQKITAEAHDPAARDTLGMAIRRWGRDWKDHVMFAMIYDSFQTERNVIPVWEQFMIHLQDLKILDAHNFKTVIDGKQLAKALGTKPGPWMKDALEVVMEWQLKNPDTATEEGAIEAVTSWQKEKGSDDVSNGDRSNQIETTEATKIQKTERELIASLITCFLQLTIRPLFSKTLTSHKNSVTETGRRRIPQNPELISTRNYEQIEDEAITRPWKNNSKNEYVLDILGWTVQNLNHDTAEKNWPQLIPPLLTLMDDVDTKYKAMGCEMLRNLLCAIKPELLKRTGLGPVFEEAIAPSLSYLPTLTPEEESVTLLNSAYPALIQLANTTHPHNDTLNPFEASQSVVPFLSKILHDHILPSITHIFTPSTESSTLYPKLLDALLEQLREVVTGMNIDAIAQLKYLIPLLREVMTQPFASKTREGLGMIAEAAVTLQQVIACAWMRMATWRGEILYATAKSWLSIVEEEEEEGGKITEESLAQARKKAKEEINNVIILLAEASTALQFMNKRDDFTTALVEYNISEDVKEMIEANDQLEPLLGRWIDS